MASKGGALFKRTSCNRVGSSSKSLADYVSDLGGHRSRFLGRQLFQPIPLAGSQANQHVLTERFTVAEFCFHASILELSAYFCQ